VLSYERRICKCPVQHRFTESADCCFAPAIHHQSSSNALPTPLACHTHVDERAALPLPS
jgi:hypothetical protein